MLSTTIRGVFISILLCFCMTINGFATHNRAGEITYRQLSDYTYEVTIITYTNTKPTSDGLAPADRPQLEIQWGDNTLSIVPRESTTQLPDFYQLNIYKATHTYSGAGTFELFVEDPNRNEGVENIPNSINVVFSIKSYLHINPILGFNNTPVLLNPPIDQGGVNKIFLHNPAAYDPDGDSLSYELTVCTGENGDPIPSYTLPPSSNRPIFIDPLEGNLTWDAPVKAGAYNIAFNIIEWRKGIKIGQITRDMQVEVFDTENEPPIIDSVIPLCIEVGQTASFTLLAYDDTSEVVSIWATGGVFALKDSATFESTNVKGQAKGSFTWKTQCHHLRKQPYQVVVKAQDDNSEVNLVDQRTVYISLVAPAPQNVSLSSTNSSVQLNWDKYFCDNQLAFKIYRSISSYGYEPDSCASGVPAYTGFKLIETINDINATSYLDNNSGLGLAQGYEYCYMVTAVFEDDFESKASKETCIELIRGTPIITNVSVESHGIDNGEIYIAWSKPRDLDTIKHPGPYQYHIKRSIGIGNLDYQTIAQLEGLEDTTFIDKGLNTSDNAYSYQVEIHNPTGLTELPMTASSIYPEFEVANKKLKVLFTHNTPWINSLYTVYRKNPGSTFFDSIGTSTVAYFIDSNLDNEESYCYQVRSEGSFDLPGIIKPIINNSHRACGVPMDTTPPAPPALSLSSDCDNFINTLTWELSDPQDEIRGYYVYFSEQNDGTLARIDSIMDPYTLNYNHDLSESPSGCYAVTAVDSAFNESEFSNISCIDLCSYYELPNVFSPNGDNVNDFFTPITPADVIDKNVDKIDLKIYSRWGNLVYESTDPNLKWDGTNINNNKAVDSGVYYYVCDVYEYRITGIELRYLVGFVHIFNDGTPNNSEK